MLFIIVLGNSDKNIIHKRVDTAIEYYNSYIDDVRMACDSGVKHVEEYAYMSHPEVYFIFTGNNNEAVKMRDYAVSKKIQYISDKNIIIEPFAKSTVENMLYSKKIIKNIIGDCTINICDVVICTSRFHIHRSKVIANDVFKGYNIYYKYPKDEVVTPDIKLKEMECAYNYLNYVIENEVNFDKL